MKAGEDFVVGDAIDVVVFWMLLKGDDGNGNDKMISFDVVTLSVPIRVSALLVLLQVPIHSLCD
jgi:hypothetical protein